MWWFFDDKKFICVQNYDEIGGFDFGCDICDFQCRGMWFCVQFDFVFVICDCIQFLQVYQYFVCFVVVIIGKNDDMVKVKSVMICDLFDDIGCFIFYGCYDGGNWYEVIILEIIW